MKMRFSAQNKTEIQEGQTSSKQIVFTLTVNYILFNTMGSVKDGSFNQKRAYKTDGTS
jgi:hypothetical protein